MHLSELNRFSTYSEKEMKKVIDTTDYQRIEQIAENIALKQKEGGRIHFTGIGKPSYVAGYMASLFSSTGSPAYVLDGTEAVHGSLGQVVAGDVVVAISNSGETEELKKTIIALSKIKCYTIGVCGNDQSWLANTTDEFLKAKVEVEGDDLNKPPRISIQAEIFILQCLSIVLQKLNHLDEAGYYLRHPGGSLGEQLKQKL